MKIKDSTYDKIALSDILFISHRLNTLKTYADEIYILENKTISLKGTHDALLETKNFYSDFYN